MKQTNRHWATLPTDLSLVGHWCDQPKVILYKVTFIFGPLYNSETQRSIPCHVKIHSVPINLDDTSAEAGRSLCGTSMDAKTGHLIWILYADEGLIVTLLLKVNV